MSDFVAAARVANIQVSPSTVAAQRARDLKAAGRNIVDMSVGEPDFDTPEDIKAEAIAAVGLTEEEPMPPQLGEACIAPLERLDDRYPVQNDELANLRGMVHRHAKGDVAATIMADDGKSFVAELVHELDTVTSLGALG